MRASRAPQEGFATIGFVAASALALVLFAASVHVVVGGYVRVAVRAAAHEGVRSAVSLDVEDPVPTCEQRAHDSLGALVRGAGRDAVDVDCTADGHRVAAVVTAEVGGWGVVPSVTVTGRATAARER